jgi:hypothetical protein
MTPYGCSAYQAAGRLGQQSPLALVQDAVGTAFEARTAELAAFRCAATTVAGAAAAPLPWRSLASPEVLSKVHCNA